MEQDEEYKESITIKNVQGSIYLDHKYIGKQEEHTVKILSKNECEQLVLYLMCPGLWEGVETWLDLK